MTESKEEKDVGVLISNDLSWDKQVVSAAHKANLKLESLARNFIFKDKSVLKTLCCTYVRPHIEFAIQAWCPSVQTHIDLLESVQRRATKMIPELRRQICSIKIDNTTS